MKKIDVAIYIILIAIGIYTIYGLTKGNNHANSDKLGMISTGSTDSGDVAIDMTPIEIDDKNLILNIALNTHSVDLSQFDLRQIATLKYNGKIVYPAEAPEIEGHHSSGKIVFDIDGNLRDFTVTIKGIPKIEERAYEWKR